MQEQQGELFSPTLQPPLQDPRAWWSEATVGAHLHRGRKLRVCCRGWIDPRV